MAAAVSTMPIGGWPSALAAYLLADRVFHPMLLEANGDEIFRPLDGVLAEILTGRTNHGTMQAR
jgi:hypothetical protein